MWVLFGWSSTLPAFLTLAAASVLLSVIDLQHQRLPNAVLGPWAVAALALLLVDTMARGTWESLLRALLGAAISFAVYLVLALISPSSLGMGDVKLAGVLGLYLGYLGWRTLILGAVGGFVIAALIGIVLLAMRRVTLRTQVPFGPPMLAAAIVAVALGAGAVGDLGARLDRFRTIAVTVRPGVRRGARPDRRPMRSTARPQRFTHLRDQPWRCWT